jgi:hypothetical protein
MKIGMLDEVRELREVGEAFLRALANRDFEALQGCLQQDVSGLLAGVTPLIAGVRRHR